MVFDALQNLAATDSARKADAADSAACDSEAEAAPARAATDNNKRKKRPLDQIIKALPVSEVIIDPPEAWTCMGAEVTKLIDYLPGRFECQQLIDRKFARTETCHPSLRRCSPGKSAVSPPHGYSAYEPFLKQPSRAGSIQLAGCLAHARRKFFEA